jgi:hypothetical protein
MLSLKMAKLFPWRTVRTTDQRWRTPPFQKGGIVKAYGQGLGWGTFQFLCFMF